MAGEYAKVKVKQFPQLAKRETSENRYWKKLDTQTLVKENTAINSVEFSPVAPHDFVFTSGLRVHLYVPAIAAPPMPEWARARTRRLHFAFAGCPPFPFRFACANLTPLPVVRAPHTGTVRVQTR